MLRRCADVTDFVGQHREQPGIRVTSTRATKLQAPEFIWNLLVPTRVARIVVVDNHRHDESRRGMERDRFTASVHSLKT